MSDPRRLLSILPWLAFLLGPAPAGALTFVKAPDSHLADRADVIVRARVWPLERPPLAEGMPSTHYSLEVVKALRGAAPGERLEIALPGGRDAAGRVAIVPGVPAFAAGEEALFFLSRHETGQLRILHMNQGIFRLAQLRGQRAAWRDFEQGNEIVAPGGEPEEEAPRDLEKFERWVAARLAGATRPEDYRLPRAAEGELQAAASAFVLYEPPARWPKTLGRLDLTFYAHEAPQPGLAGGGYAEVQTALAAWSDLPEGLLRLRYGGTTSSTVGFRRNDGINAIVFDNYGAAKPDLQPFNCATGFGYLGFAIVWQAGTHSYAGQEVSTIVGADAVTNDDFDCFGGFGSVSFEFVLAHELGHLLGLSHACEFGNCATPEEAASVMHNRFPDNSGARLSEDDRRAIVFLYGPPRAPGPLQAQPAGHQRVRLSWEDASDNESAFVVYRGRNGDLRQIGRTGPGATRFEDGDAEPGATYVYQVRAENENGASAAVEAVVTTADVLAPAQLRAIEAGPDFLTLTWVDRTSSESGFEVWGHFAGPDERLATLPANSTTARLEGLIADTVYQLKVRAIGLPTGNTAFSSTVAAGTRPAPVAPCEESPSAACLGAERFKVEVRWKDLEGQRGEAQVAPAGSADSGIFYFFSPNNWEMLVKVLDGCAINQRHWVFAAGTTDVETSLIVTDSQTGKTAVYWSPLGTASPAVTDIEAFAGCAETAAVKSAAPPTALATGCDGTPGNLCLLGGRYEVAVTWTDFAGVSGSGKAVPAGSADSGLFTFFSPDNWEMLVKVLDGCAINGNIWVFAAATTNVAYTLKVTDTETGLARIYENLLGQASPAITDIEAFAACPDP